MNFTCEKQQALSARRVSSTMQHKTALPENQRRNSTAYNKSINKIPGISKIGTFMKDNTIVDDL